MRKPLGFILLTTLLLAGSVDAGQSISSKVRFEENLGQVDERVLFVGRAPGFLVHFTRQEAVFVLSPEVRRSAVRMPFVDALADYSRQPAEVVRMRFQGADEQVRLSGESPLTGATHYRIGLDPDRHVNGVPAYGAVRYNAIYPGIDLVFYERNGSLEFDFIVAPGATADSIGLEFSGLPLTLSASGDLLLGSVAGLMQRAPESYQIVDGSQVSVPSRFVLGEDDRVGFAVGAYDRAAPLVIDPMALRYSTYLGGVEPVGPTGDRVIDVAVDPSGAAYATGVTAAPSFPTDPSAEMLTETAVYVAKLAPGGVAMDWITYIGGTDFDLSTAIAVDATGASVVVGRAVSSDFPVSPDAIQGNQADDDGFVFKLLADGTFVFATYLGGDGVDFLLGVDLEPDGDIWVAGESHSTDFPTVAPIQAERRGNSDGLLARISQGGSVLDFSTYLGGASSDQLVDVEVVSDVADRVVVAGNTFSDDLPSTAGTFQPAYAGGADAFAARVDASTPSILVATYLGGSANDAAQSLALDWRSVVYVAGVTSSADFPTTPGALQETDPAPGFATAGFVTKLAPGMTSPGTHYSTYIGGANDSSITEVVADNLARAWIVGTTEGGGFPLEQPLSGRIALGGTSDGFVSLLAASGSELVFSSYLGGTLGGERVGGIDLERDFPAGPVRGVYVGGETTSSDFPLVRPLQPALLGDEDGFVAKLLNWPRLTISTGVVSWVDDFGAERFDVVFGDLFRMRGFGAIQHASLACVGQAIGGTSMFDQMIPGPGEGFFYLVRPIIDGTRGTFGVGGGQAASRDQQIDGLQTCILPAVCEHDTCEEGAALVADCDLCVEQVCQQDSFCCETAWDATCVAETRTICGSQRCPDPQQQCPHGFCVPGDPLGSFCDVQPDQTSCADKICQADPRCCQLYWSDACIEKVESICGLSCH